MSENIMLPSIHVNGTSARQLLDDYHDAAHHLQEALNALDRCAPNGRDYYPQGQFAINRAIEEHVRRTSWIRSALAEIEAIGEHVSNHV